ncbi:MAG: glycosyl hydrolase [Lachnospiraceae bacterium]|nr:glycosyl hydrolase [Lachnospiraceae bacterium]
MLYEEKNQPFSVELFQNPTASYRGTPFWAWNCVMSKEHIDRSIEALSAMGMGGGHIHCRTGMANTYLGEGFLELVKYAHKEFENRDMLTWLYDEDRWPSGAGGGYVTRDHAYRIRFLVFSPKSLDGTTYDASNLSSTGQAIRSNERRLLARYAVRLEQGFLTSYRRLEEGETLAGQEHEWFAYLEISGDNPWFNNQAYLNTLDKKAVERFVEVTHEAYHGILGDEFGGSVPAIFTDEPQFSHKARLEFAEDQIEITLPFTDDLEETFREQYGHSLMEHLPELFWELPQEKISLIRYEYHDHIAERFAHAFADTIGDWCSTHHIMLTGHMMEEPTLESQTTALGEAMRSYRSFHLPGIDMLCDRRELSTAKQAQSASHQFGRPGVLSELYGVTNWDFDFKGHKLQGDWQAALGVTVRVPHLTWTSMQGEAKRDYPASIGFQSPWFRQYPYIEDYFARVSTILTRGCASVRVGVIHPIESYWLYWGPEEQTGSVRREMDENFDRLIRYMLYGLQDFDFLCESLLPELTQGKKNENGKFSVGQMQYDVILVPNCRTLRTTTIELLTNYVEEGGTVIFTGEVPYLEGAVSSGRPGRLAEKCRCIPFNREALLEELEPYRFVDVRDASGNRTTNLIYQLREDGQQKWLFLAHVEEMKNPDIPQGEVLKIMLQGEWKVTEYDALCGQIKPCSCVYEDGKTIIYRTLYEQDSLLLGMEPTEQACCGDAAKTVECITSRRRIVGENRVPVRLEEPNVLVLDQAEYRFDDGEWQQREEVLRLDNAFREKLGYPLRMEAFAQPWVDSHETRQEKHDLWLRMHIVSQVDVPEVWLGIEEAEEIEILWNGSKTEETGEWYVDPCIQKIRLGALCRGENELLLHMPFYPKRNVEGMYLLGNFGVRVEGACAVVTEPVSTLAFGDITSQGLPFYGGNLVYEIPVELEEEETLWMEVSKFRAPVMQVQVDGVEKGYVAFSPYRVELGTLKKGKHMVEITMFGNRVNTFGMLHNCDEQMEWGGPNAWRTAQEAWAYEYQLHRVGILKAPEIFEIK